MRRALAGCALIAGLALTSGAWADHEFDGRDLVAGKAVYAAHCADCHGAALEGQPNWQSPGESGVLPAPPHDASGHTWHHSNQQLFDYTKLGGQGVATQLGLRNFTSGMPGFDGVLSDAEIWQVLAYIASTWPAREAEVEASRNPRH